LRRPTLIVLEAAHDGGGWRALACGGDEGDAESLTSGGGRPVGRQGYLAGARFARIGGEGGGVDRVYVSGCSVGVADRLGVASAMARGRAWSEVLTVVVIGRGNAADELHPTTHPRHQERHWGIQRLTG
jgi:hypothetical protein